MGSIQGKMTVDLYANPDPFVQGMKAAENAAKKSGGGIAASIEKINAKQIKNLGNQLLGGLGVIGMVDAGGKMALEMIKGFKEGGEKGLSGAMEIIGNSLITTIKSIPIAGTFFEIGKSIGEWANGVDAANASIARSNEQMKRTTDIVSNLRKLQSPESEITTQQKKNDQFGQSPEMIAQESMRQKKLVELKNLSDSQMKDAQEKTKAKMAEYDAKRAERQKTRDPIIQTEAQAAKTRQEYEEKIGLELDQQYKAIQSQVEEAKKTIELNVQDLVVLQQKGKAQQDLAQFHKDSANELKAQNDQQAATAEWVEQQHQRYLDLGRTKRMIYELELQSHKGMTDAGKKQLMQEFDALEAVKKTADAKQEAAQQAADDLKASAILETDIATAKKDVNDLAKNNMATVDSAIGSIKVAGSQDFSKSTEMALAQKTLTNAIELKKTMESVDKTLKTMGGVT